MANVQQFYANKRAKVEEIAKQFPDGACLVVSVDNLDKNSKAGNLCEVTVDNAARLIVEGTHKLASKEDYKSFQAAQETERKRIADATLLAAQRQFAANLGVKPSDIK